MLESDRSEKFNGVITFFITLTIVMKTSESFDKRYLKLPCSRFAGCLESDGHYKMNVCIIWASLRNNRNSLYKCNLPDNALAPAGSILPAFVFIGTNRISKNRMSVV